MTSRQTLFFVLLATIILIGSMVLVVEFSNNVNSGFKDAATIISIVTGISVGIERVIEGFWTVIGLTRDQSWPSGVLTEQMDTLVSNLDTTMGTIHQQVEATIQQVAEKGNWTQQQIAAAMNEIEIFKTRLIQFQTLAPKDQRIQLISSTAQDWINYLQKKYPTLQDTFDIATQAINDLSVFIAAFQDNPGRRLISLYTGAILGVIMSGVLGLNLLVVAGTGGYSSLVVRLGVALTGLVMGLGSNPTHEVIRVIQEYKTNLKTQIASPQK